MPREEPERSPCRSEVRHGLTTGGDVMPRLAGLTELDAVRIVQPSGSDLFESVIYRDDERPVHSSYV
jgi:hypothetical protein